jgi:glycosyltransferase involved in cell wall biosynthesis
MSVDRPAVTIGVPFVNAERTLREAIQSIFAQTREDWELLLVDDGSRDGSLAMARAIDDPRVRVVSDGVNRGVVYRANQMADLARAPYLCRLDDDDIMHPRRLEAQVAYLDAHPDVDVVSSPMISMDETGAIRGVRGVGAPRVGDPISALRGAPLAQGAAMGRTLWFAKNRYDPQYLRAEDHELWCRTAPYSHFAITEEPYLFCREPARVNLTKYVLSCRTDRVIYRQFGPGRVGRSGTALLVARSFAKEALYRAGCRLGFAGRLVARRTPPAAPEVVARAAAALEQVRRTPVPGLVDDPAAREQEYARRWPSEHAL